MAIGTTAALLIGSGIAGGAQAYGAKKASDASKKAARMQQEAAERALEFEREQFNRALAALAPWTATSQAAMGRLSDLLGLPRQALTDGTAMASVQGMLGPNGQATARPQVMPQPMPAGAPAAGVPIPVGSGQTPAAVARSGAMPLSMLLTQPEQAVGRTLDPSMGLVRVRHPKTGEERAVPRWQANVLVQRGGQVVG